MRTLDRVRVVRTVREARDVLADPRAVLRDPAVLRPSRPRLLVDLAGVEASPDDEAYARAYLPAGYVVRETPAYFADADADGTIYQPDVYRLAGRLAGRLGARAVVDVGCGTGDKLAALAGRFATFGLDHGPNVAEARARHGDDAASPRTWLEHDLDAADDDLPIEGAAAPRMLVCADVVEHVRHPHRLLGKLRRAVGDGDLLVLSTPDRVRTRDPGAQSGPPPNRAHAREWSLDELARLLRASGFEHGRVGLTRSNTRSPRRATILAVAGAAGTLARAGLGA